MKKIIRTAAMLSAAAVALLGPTAASAASGGTGRPYKASGVLTGLIDTTDFTYVLTGPTVGTHYGKGPTTVVGDFAFTQTFTVTAANGDTILGELVGSGDTAGIQCPEGWEAFSDVDQFTGGTGRFVNATGTISVWGCSLIDFATGAFTVSFNASGTISY